MSHFFAELGEQAEDVRGPEVGLGNSSQFRVDLSVGRLSSIMSLAASAAFGDAGRRPVRAATLHGYVVV